MKSHPYIGQDLYILNIGNAARWMKQELRPCKVIKVGRKYFDVQIEKGYGIITFYIGNGRQKTEYSANYKLYESPQDLEDEHTANKICECLGKAFEYGYNKLNLSLDKLVKINKIVLE